ncbi:MAG: hypothetical protein K2X86_06900 [Cytophagaceae bacterium]|nr:hypothetical protein [Cytophagaceae bacterium]
MEKISPGNNYEHHKEFEYSWRTTDLHLFTNEPAKLPYAIWQDSTDAVIVFEGE